MRWCCWLLIGFLLSSTTGCSCGGGAASLKDLKRRAIVRDEDVDETPVAPAPPPIPKATDSAPEEIAPPAVVAAPKPPPAVTAEPEGEQPMPEPTAPAKVTKSPVDVARTTVPPDDEGPDGPVVPVQPAPKTITPRLGETLPVGPITASVSSAPETRAPIPTATEQQAGKRILAELYRDEYARARMAEQKRALAKKLFAKAQEIRDDLVGQYLLLKLSLDLSANVGDVEQTLSALEVLSSTFQINGTFDKLTTLEALSKALRSQNEAQLYLAECRRLMLATLEADDFETASRLLALAETVAKRGKMNDQLIQIDNARKMIAETKLAFIDVPAARSALETDPTNADANLVVGKYLCCYRRRWDEGLQHLAQGSDVKFKVLAQIELSLPGSATQQADLADQWYDLSQFGGKQQVKAALALRAAHWYQLALEGLPNGLVKTRVQKRLGEIATWSGDEGLKTYAVTSKPAALND
jgi:hypothetical protein